MNEERESEEVEELKEGSTMSTAGLPLEQALCSPCSDFTAFWEEQRRNGGLFVVKMCSFEEVSLSSRHVHLLAKQSWARMRPQIRAPPARAAEANARHGAPDRARDKEAESSLKSREKPPGVFALAVRVCVRERRLRLN